MGLPPATVAQCSDITGREVGMFVQVPGDPKYFWERTLSFEGSGWRVQRVVIGEPADVGRTFHLVLVPLSAQAVAEFQKHDGTAYFVTAPPVQPLATLVVTRSDQLGNC
ncbi:hypothetical protein Cs7R123_02120 [Catellatospora sp. TT07R-123]|uniref:hypothetical protein n=1 Tax=Catellatospora sp. TT07R-123 TaxID=2733863 RepID=UPI001B2524E0|nr:hypothetical protein [Catellatospora sp. TT07R-123]GHJ42870.1 hypothetical protein Cs7R123_02120 [Catellatospora sp. TT07R-123]